MSSYSWELWMIKQNSLIVSVLFVISALLIVWVILEIYRTEKKLSYRELIDRFNSKKENLKERLTEFINEKIRRS
ncbi:hypothetical protein [Mycoplasma parvum]|uniref:Uncharacterized protein n=1 Tax=Mycoplasma parvum str. Indiana TaxID=1403316 RepID=U5NC57_9MOLU|nr:hypothetical protein [Mycoplasma parvum]AGX88997.1 hypothetical protein PRV_01175 [Mycoplasma parvum str. Indiana]